MVVVTWSQNHLHCNSICHFLCLYRKFNTRIELFPGSGRPRESKVCFVAYRDHSSAGPQVFITDMAAGQLYVTSTRTRDTEVKSLSVNGTNLLKQAVGVAFDATGLSCS